MRAAHRKKRLMMQHILQSVFRIQSGEGQKVILFALLGALMSGGLTIGMSAVDAIFLTEAGPDRLPLIYLLTPLVMLFYIPLSSYLLARYGIDRLFDITIGILAVGGVVLFGLLSGDYVEMSPVLLIAVKLYVNMWLYALFTLYWNFTDSYFDILDAKRLFSFFSGGSAFGAMLGGAMTAWLIQYIEVHYLFLVWTGLTLLSAPLLIHTRRIATQIDMDETLDDTPLGFLEQMRNLGRTLRSSRYVFLLSLIFFVTLAITLICEYQYMSIFSGWAADVAKEKLAADAGIAVTGATIETYSSRELAALFGRLNAYANVFNLVINLFLFNRLIIWLGVRNVALIQPLAYVVSFTYLLLAYDFPAAVVGFFAYQGVMIAIDQNNQNFLFNALPTEGKKQLRTFVECVCEPLAVATAGLFLILFARDVGTVPVQDILTRLLGEDTAAFVFDYLRFGSMTATEISAIGLGGAVLCLLLVFVLRVDYVQAMIINLKKGWLDFSRSIGEPEARVLDRDVATLLDVARAGDAAHTLAAVRMLIKRDRHTALRALLDFWKRATPEERRSAQPLLGELLQDEDVDRVRLVMKWLEDEAIDLDPALIEELGSRNLIQPEAILPFIDSERPEMRGAASVALWSSWNIDHGLDSFQTIRALLRGSEDERCMAVRALGRSNRERYAHSLASYLGDPAPAVRREALTAILRLVNRDSVRLIPRIIEAIAEGDTPTRTRGMEVLGRIGDSSCIVPLLAAARSFTPYERRKAEDLITQIGLQSVPATVSILQDRHYPHKSRSIAARALARLSFAQFEALEREVIDGELQRAYEFAMCQQGLRDVSRGSHGLSLLLRFYQDMQEVVVDFVLEMMTIGGRLPSYELLSTSLRSTNPKERANAIETIEQGCSAATFHALLPLIAGRDLKEKQRVARSRYRLAPQTVDTIVERALDSAMPIECSAALQSVWDAGGDKAADTLRHKLLHTKDDQVRQNILQLLDKEAGAVTVTEIEKLNLLAHTPFFAAFGIEELAICARDVTEQIYEDGTRIYQAGDEANDLHLIVEGQVELNMNGTRWMRGAGDTIGEDAVMGLDRRSVDAVSGGARVLTISRNAVLDTARTYPRVAIGLLAKKWV